MSFAPGIGPISGGLLLTTSLISTPSPTGHLQQVFAAVLPVSVAGTDVYVGPTFSAYGWTTGTPAPWLVAGTFRDATVTLTAGPGTGKTVTFTLVKNGIDTALTITLADTATEGRSSASVAVAAGDLLVWRRSVTGSPSVTGWWMQPSVAFLSSSAVASGYGAYGLAVSPSASFRSPLFFPHQLNTGSAGVEMFGVVSVDGALTDLAYVLTVAPGVGHTHTFTVIVNGTAQNGTGGTIDTRVVIAGTATTGTWTGSLPLTAGDGVVLQQTGSGAAGSALSYSVRFEADEAGRSVCGNDPFASLPAIGTTAYATALHQRIGGGSRSAWAALESDAEVQVSAPCVLRDLRVRCWQTSSGQVFTLRKNGAATALSCTTASGVASDLTHEVALVAGDRIALQYVGASAPATADVGAFGFAMVALGTPPTTTLSKDDEWCGVPQLAWVNLFHTDATGADLVSRWSEVPVAGAAYALEGRALHLGVAERKASENGALEGSTFSFTLADTDNQIRGMLGRPAQIALFDLEVVVAIARLADVQAGLDPLIAFRGVVKTYKATGRQFTFDCQDWLSARIATLLPLPQAGTAFPGAPQTTRDRVGPLLYGAVSDEGSSGAGPLNAPEAVSETSDNLAGFGRLGGTPPTGVTLIDAGATGSLEAQTYYVMATTVKDGVESDPSPFYGVRTVAAGAVSVTVADGHAVTASCTNMGAAADTYRFHLGYFGADYLWQLWVESVTPSVTFTSLDPTVQAGGHPAYLAIWSYAASFLYADGETALTTDVDVLYIGLPRGFRRPVRLVFEPAPVGVTGMRVYRKMPGNPYDRVWTVPLDQLNTDGNLYFEDDLLDTGATFITHAPTPSGRFTPFYVGEFDAVAGGTWRGFAIAGHACADPAVLNVYVDGVAVDPGMYGVSIAAPGQPGFATYFGASTYRLGADGSRWTLLYLIGPDAEAIVAGTKTLTVNVQGVEDVGDGTGVLLASGNAQALHFATNFVMASTPWAGDQNWLDLPTWTDGEPRIDVDSFDRTEAEAARQILDTSCARAITTIRPMLAVLTEMAIDADAAYCFTRTGQFRWFLEDPAPGAVAIETIDELLDTAADSFAVTDETDPVWFHNQVTYSFDPTYDASGTVTLAQTATVNDLASQRRYATDGGLRVIPAPSPLQFFGRRNAGAVAAILNRYRARHANTPRHIDQTLGLYWYLREPGDVVAVTHSEGMDVSGWTGELMRIRQIAGDFGPYTVALRGRQLSTALLFTLPAWQVEECMSDTDLGGRREGSPVLASTASQTVLPVEYRDRAVQWPIVPVTATVTAVVTARVDNAALTLTPELYNVTDAAVVVTGSAVTATSDAEQTITLPRPVDDETKVYRLRVTVTGGHTIADPLRTVGVYGALRVTFP